jgi:hypothetical protein
MRRGDVAVVAVAEQRCACGCGGRPKTPGVLYLPGHQLAAKYGGHRPRLDRCEGKGKYRDLGCGAVVLRKPSRPRRKTGLCAACLRAAYRTLRVEVPCTQCDRPLSLQPGEVEQQEHHFCNQECARAWRMGRYKIQPRRGQRTQGRPRGRRARKIRALKEQASYASIARAAGVSAETVRNIAIGRRKGDPLTRRRLERVGFLPDQGWQPLAALILDDCIDTGIRSLTELARRAEMSLQTLVSIVHRGNAERETLGKLAPALKNRTPAELEALCDPDRRHHHPKTLATLGFFSAAKTERPPDIEPIIARVLSARPDVDEREIRRHLEALRRKVRGPGRPRTFTDDQALEAARLHGEGKTLAEIGTAMGWPVKNRRSWTAERAVERGLCLRTKPALHAKSLTGRPVLQREQERAMI